MNARRRQGGFILLPVVLILALLATLAFLLNRESGMGVQLAANEGVGDRARYVAEAGLAQARWLVNQSGCTGYTDLAGVSFGGGTYDVSVTPTDGSPVSLTAAAALPDGTRRTLTKRDVAVYQPPVTLVQQPDAATGEDTWIYEWKPSWNYGADTQIGVDTYYAYSEARPLLRFDLGAIPAGAKVLGATLELYMNSPSDVGGPVAVHRFAADWVEGDKSGGTGAGANWNTRDGTTPWATPGGEFDPQVVTVTAVAGGAVGWHVWDITALIDGWQAGTFPNQGLMLRMQQTGRAAYFHSSDYSNASLRPKLTVTYACECGVPCTSGATPTAVLLVVPDAAAPSAQDDAKQSLIQSWGHTVALISAAAPQAEFDAAVLDSDVAYVSEEILSTDLGSKLRDAAIGVVNEEQALTAEFGFSSTNYVPTPTTSLNITDNGHYITTPFATGWLGISSSSQEVVSLAGTLAGGLEALGYFEAVGGPPGLAVIDTGAALYAGGTAAARRVQLPWGGNTFDVNALTVDGQTLMRRAIEWAAGGGGGGEPPPPSGPLTLSPVADATIYEAAPDENYGTQDQMRVGEDAGGSRYRSLMRFDVSGVPADATVTAATLRTYIVAGSGSRAIPVGIYRLTGAWEEPVVTWNSSGAGTSDPTQLAESDIPRNFTGWVEWSLPTGLIHEWVDGVAPNHGLLLNYEGPWRGNFRAPATRENTATDQRPQLVIEYLSVVVLPPPEPVPL